MTKKNKNIVSKSGTKKQEPQIDESRLIKCEICFETIAPTHFSGKGFGGITTWYEGCNADPVIPEGRCCDRCDKTVVIPIRILLYQVTNLDDEAERNDPYHHKSSRARTKMMIDFKLSQLSPDTFDEVFKNKGYDERYKREFKKYSKQAKALGLGSH